MNEYQKKYQEQSIMQMSQGELLVLTFDEAIKSLKLAESALEDKKYDKFDCPLSSADPGYGAAYQQRPDAFIRLHHL